MMTEREVIQHRAEANAQMKAVCEAAMRKYLDPDLREVIGENVADMVIANLVERHGGYKKSWKHESQARA